MNDVIKMVGTGMDSLASDINTQADLLMEEIRGLVGKIEGMSWEGEDADEVRNLGKELQKDYDAFAEDALKVTSKNVVGTKEGFQDNARMIRGWFQGSRG